ncbi:MAG: response regulator transcription factor [Lachnospiraceae bacterium]|nr:response regulator transcription factor [Lachnospiraceae bacterium]
MYKIAVIEDDRALREEVLILLKNAGYDVAEVDNFENVAEQLKNMEVDLILLDINLPGENGEAILQEYRKEKNTPVIMLTSRTSEMDEVLSMSFGADDYVTKPYNPTILLLRISAVLRRQNPSGGQLNYDDVKVSTVKGTLTRGEKEQILTKNEMIIFQLLLEKRGSIVSRDELMTALWDNEEYINDNALTVNISRLRTKLSELGIEEGIETRKKQGYRLK